MFNKSLVVMAFLLAIAFDAPALPAQTAPPEIQPVLLQMIRDDAVHRELNLSEDQVRQVFAALEPIDGPWFRVRIRPAQERIETIDRLSEQLADALAEILDSKQLNRLDQLHNQALGTRMIVRDKTATALGLSPATRESLYEVFAKTDSVVAGVQQQSQAQSLDAAAAAKKIDKAKADEKKALVDALTNQQKRTLSSLTGPAFNFAAVKRMYPAAPELTSEGASWLQGDPLTLDGLKGKVVAVHFYAFQCINCRRNLPHYNRWHADYADKGLVVIGIQTPETAAERSADRVAAALQTEQIQYPVLMDAQSANWKQWSNTMWPTVYLVDKKGFLRRWWQGEMNWKGTPGEAQMRETIEQLLAEE
ncbi:redoxin domain-containing protein [Planctomycetes bacterium TBK1r]|uniref:Thiol-disulfide oxidoreductase YkuV n=1 Tax=Stieleria magnilauensis TaxID=2527963 RepID=A0ABX5XKI9_9BACT|nr:Thiol-disulfide oxidoreductase YkuV [Planctomycetes bacterium TBK1r]